MDDVVAWNRDTQGPSERQREGVGAKPCDRKVANLDALDPLRLREGHLEVTVAVNIRRIDRDLVPPSRQLPTQLETILRWPAVPRG